MLPTASVVCIGLLAAWPGMALAAEWKPLRASYALTGATLIDPPPDEPRASHLRIQFDGASAREVYAALPGAEREDQCTGGRVKAAGALRCVKARDGRRYECDFGIELGTQRIVYGVVC